MTNPQPLTMEQAFQLGYERGHERGYERALRDLDPYIEALIDALDASIDCIRNPDEYHRNKDEADYAVRNYRNVRRSIAVEMGIDAESNDFDARVAAKLERQRRGILDPIKPHLRHTVLSAEEQDAWAERSRREID